MKNKRAIIVLIVIIAMGCITSRAQDDIGNVFVYSFVGEILEVNEDNSIVSVKEIPRFPDLQYASRAEMAFPVSSKTKILQGSDPIDITDLTAGQRVTVRYYTDNTGAIVTLSIVADL